MSEFSDDEMRLAERHETRAFINGARGSKELRRAFIEGLAPAIQHLKAEMWEQGYLQGREDVDFMLGTTPNPYRSDALSASTDDGRPGSHEQPTRPGDRQPAGSEGQMRGHGDGTREGDAG